MYEQKKKYINNNNALLSLYVSNIFACCTIKKINSCSRVEKQILARDIDVSMISKRILKNEK